MTLRTQLESTWCGAMDDYPVLLGDAEDELESIDLELGVIQMEMESLEEKRQRLLERRRKITQEKKDQEERRKWVKMGCCVCARACGVVRCDVV